MTDRKRRLTVTVDPELVEAAQEAVKTGQAESVSGWVSSALEDRIRRDRKLALLAAAIADYEREHGEITTQEIVAQQRIDRRDATLVQDQRRQRKRQATST